MLIMFHSLTRRSVLLGEAFLYGTCPHTPPARRNISLIKALLQVWFSEAAELSYEAAEFSSEAAEFSSEAEELSYKAAELSYAAAELSSEAAEFSSEAEELNFKAAELSSEAAEFSSEAEELNYKATELSSEAAEFSAGRFAWQFVWFCESEGSLHVPKVYVFQRKSMVLGTPNAKIVRNVEDLGQPRQAAFQSPLRVTTVFLSDLYDFVIGRDSLATFPGVL